MVQLDQAAGIGGGGSMVDSRSCNGFISPQALEAGLGDLALDLLGLDPGQDAFAFFAIQRVEGLLADVDAIQRRGMATNIRPAVTSGRKWRTNRAESRVAICSPSESASARVMTFAVAAPLMACVRPPAPPLVAIALVRTACARRHPFPGGSLCSLAPLCP